MSNHIHNNRGESGFTLVELAVVLAIAGIMIAGAIMLVLPLIQKARMMETEEKLAKVEEALNSYALSNYRLPCPAVPNTATANPPYGFEDGSGAAGDTVPAACPTTEGIVPFNTLRLPEDMVRDAWGQHFTYGVSPAFAQDTNAGLPASIHAECRTREWMFDIGFNAAGERLTANRNPQKARFCCPGTPAAATDLIILDEDGNRVVEVLDNGGPRSPAGFARTPPDPDPLYGEDWYDTADTRMEPYDVDAGSFCDQACARHFNLPQVPPDNIRATAPAYILISHGPNGFGAYIPLSGGRYAPAGAGTPEAENTDGDATYIDRKTRVYDEASAISFDDYVIWRTQDVILSSQGESCAVP